MKIRLIDHYMLYYIVTVICITKKYKKYKFLFIKLFNIIAFNLVYI